MALIDSSIYQNAPQSLLRAGLNGYESAMKSRDASIQRRGLLEERDRQEQERIRKRSFRENLSGLMGSYGEYGHTPEGEREIFDHMSRAGYGQEMIGLMGGIPKTEQKDLNPDLWSDVSGAKDPTLYNKRTGEIKATGVAGKPEKPTDPTAYEMAKDKWDREYKERQIAISSRNITKDNDLATSKAELARIKQEAELASKAVDVNEVEAQADSAVSLIDQMIGNEDGQIKKHPGFGGYVGAKGPSSLWGILDKPISGTDAAGFSALYDQVKGTAFLGAVEKMRGLGALGEKEGAAATSAATRMQAAQSEEEFVKAAKEFRAAIKGRTKRVVAKATGITPGKGHLSKEEAMEYLMKAGGNRSKAEFMAKKDGRSF